MKSNQLFYHSQKIQNPIQGETNFPQPVKTNTLKDKYPLKGTGTFHLEDSADDSELNRPIILKSFDNDKMVEGKPGKIYYDKDTNKVKIYLDGTGWVNVKTE